MTVAHEQPHSPESEAAAGTRRPQSFCRLGRWPRRSQSQKRTKLALALALAVAGTAGAFGASAAIASVARWRPPARITWYWQLQGPINNAVNVDVYDIDGFDTRASEVARLHSRARHVICYIDIGSWERWRPDSGTFPRSVLGRGDGWPGERWLDVRRLKLLAPIMTARLRMCARKGFDAVEGDLIDGFANNTGFHITAAQQLRYDEWFAGEAHRLGLSALQKNDPEQARTLEPSFDGELDEQCNQYRECSAFKPYLAAGKPVLNAEYRRSLYPGFCASDARLGITGALYGLALDGRMFKPCPVAHVSEPGLAWVP
jgi:hypothetical protein